MLYSTDRVSNNLTIFRDGEEGLMYGSLKGNTFLLETIQGNMFKVADKDFDGNIVSNTPELQFYEIKTKDGFRTFLYLPISTTQVVKTGGGGRRGISGINIQDEDIQFAGTFNTLNFEGAGVVVTDDGDGTATVTIGGGGMIFGAGTPNRLAMFTAPNTIGDSPFLRSGSDVIADGDLFFASGNGIDVTASGGADVLNIGTSNADVINYGYAGTTHNMNGTVFNVFTTNLNVTDKIITLNDGGAAGSGGNVGFEIEEGGVATGYFIQNATRNGFDFQASAITGVATFDLSLLTANRTATLQNASGTIAYLSDIPAPVAAFVQNGNSFGAPAVLGTNDVFSLSFETSGTTRGTISSGGLWGINTTPVAGTLFIVVGTGATAATYTAQFHNSTGTSNTLILRDDGFTGFGVTTPTTVGFSAAGSTVEMTKTLLLTTDNASIALMRTGGANYLQFEDSNNFNITQANIDGTNFNPKMTFYPSGIVKIAADSDNFANVGSRLEVFENAVGISDVLSLGNNQAFAVGNGAMLSFKMQADDGNLKSYAGIFGVATSTGTLTYDGDLVFETTLNSSLTEKARLDSNGNFGLGTAVFGTNAATVLGIANGTAPTTSPVNMIQIFSVDTDDGTASLGLRTEQAVVTETIVSDRTLKVTINGTIYKICLKV